MSIPTHRLFAALLVLSFLVQPPHAEALTKRQVKCREAAARIARHAGFLALKARFGCLERHISGAFDPSVDCHAEPEELGGPGTGVLIADRRLAKLVFSKIRSGDRLTNKCDHDDPALDVDPSDVGLDVYCPAAPSADWNELADCLVERGMDAALHVVEVLNVEGPGPLDPAHVNCVKQAYRKVRQTMGGSNQWRAHCFAKDDTLAVGGGILDCGANISPPGIVETTSYAKADKRLAAPWPNLDAEFRDNCASVSLEAIGFNAVPALTELSGGRYELRYTLEDVIHNAQDRLHEAINTLTFGDPDVPLNSLFPLANITGFCGDGNLDAGEACDDGNNTSCDGCDRDCSLPACGNGSLCGTSGEECDDGNTNDLDGCSSTCLLEACPNGITEPGYDEDCDDNGESATCDTDCTTAMCGDVLINVTAGEVCDEGTGIPNNTPTNTATCDSDCSPPMCPDGHLNPLNTTEGTVTPAGEECDDNGETLSCDNNCTFATCGDGDLNATRGETCDDGNAVDTDSCPSSNPDGNSTSTGHCLTATCGDGFLCSDGGSCTSGPGAGVEACDGGGDAPLGSGESLTCNSDCSLHSCGDGFLNPTAGEQCDDGGSNSDNAPCTAVCEDAVCGDGKFCNDASCTSGPGGGPEECDDENAVNTDPCLDTCAVAVCGDGVTCLDPSCTSGPAGGPEECDDAGESVRCDADCTASACGDNVLNTTAGETCDDGAESVACNSDCTDAVCGDGKLNTSAGENCDDGGANGDSDECLDNCTIAVCGDGIICSNPSCNTAGRGPEGCDDSGETVNCTTFCTLSVCGDGITNTTAGEQCDDSGESSTCDSDCTPAVCGDGVTNAAAGEQCDAGAGNDSNSPDQCGDGAGPSLRGACQNPSCGDGVVDTGESCDDGASNGSGEGFCVSDCSRVQTCGDGNNDGPSGTNLGTESCDDGDTEQCGACNATCTGAGIGAVVCGDGVICGGAYGETCDDSDAEECGTCNATCDGAGIGAAVCGDGITCGGVYGENCDDGFTDACGTCNATCTAAGAGSTCGDGAQCPETEACDDGYTDACGTCNATCTAAGFGGFCGDGTQCPETGEECDDGGVTNGDTCSSLCLDERYVFQTNATFGSGGTPPTGFSSVGDADTLCQNAATAAALPGTYKAWISDSSAGPAMRFDASATGAAGPFILVSGTRVADDWADLTDGTIQAGISLDETGGVPSSGTSDCTVTFSEAAAWTNTQADGTPKDTSGGLGNDHCNNWTDSSTLYDAGMGDGGSTGPNAWTDSCLGAGDCDKVENLYCVQQ